MKKTFLSIAVLLLGCLFSACNHSGEEINLYFGNAEKTALVTERFVIKDTSAPLKEKAEIVINTMLSGPSASEHSRLIPKETRLLDLSYSGGVVTVNLSTAFDSSTMPHTDAILAQSSVIKTLTEISGIDKVQLLVDGASIISAATGEPVPAMGFGDIVTSPGGDTMDKVVLTLYFNNPATMLLCEEKRVIDIKETTTMAKVVVTELLKGPENKAFSSLLSSEASLISADTKEGVCFVNFDKSFLNKSITDSETETLAIYSLVNALTELSGVESVQFLIKGEKVERLGKISIREPFGRNELLIEGFVPPAPEAVTPTTEEKGEENDEL